MFLRTQVRAGFVLTTAVVDRVVAGSHVPFLTAQHAQNEGGGSRHGETVRCRQGRRAVACAAHLTAPVGSIGAGGESVVRDFALGWSGAGEGRVCLSPAGSTT
jgi:hypothetical protein